MLNPNQINLYLESIEAKIEAREKEKQFLISRDLPFSERCFLVDTREPNPYYFKNTYRTCLPEGDYSLDGYEGLVVIERKEKNDLINTLIRGKERFNNELRRLQKYEAKCVLVECNYSDIILGKYISQALPQSIIGLLHSASYHNNVPFLFISDFGLANRFTQKYLLCYARKKENNYSFPAPTRPLELKLENTVISYSLEDFIKEVSKNKIDFKWFLNQLKSYPSSAIILECCYSDIINQVIENTTLEDIVISIIVDHKIPVYFMESKSVSEKWKENHLKRFRPPIIREKKVRKNAKKG